LKTFNFVAECLKPLTPKTVNTVFWNSGESIETQMTFDPVPGLTQSCRFSAEPEYKSTLPGPRGIRDIQLHVDKKQVYISVNTASKNDIEHHLSLLSLLAPKAEKTVRRLSLKRELESLEKEREAARSVLSEVTTFKKEISHGR